MHGTILNVVNGRSIWLLVVDAVNEIVEQGIEARYMRDIVEAEGLESPYDLVGREIELAEDKMSIGLP
jgi:hypothetical protein